MVDKLTSPEAEKVILGYLLSPNNPILVSEIISQLTIEDFYVPAHQTLFLGIKKQFESGTPVDPIKLEDDFFTIPYLLDLKEASFFMPDNIVQSRLDIISDKSRRRLALRKMEELKQEIMEEDDVSYDGYINELMDITHKKSKQQASLISNDMPEVLDSVEKMMSGEEVGLPSISTGLTTLDDIMEGGFHKDELIFIAARPAMGKSSLAITEMAANVAVDSGKVVLVMSLEMGRQALARRVAFSRSEMPLHKFRMNVEEHEVEHFAGKVEEVSDSKLYICDNPNVSSSSLRAEMNRVKALEGRLDFVVIDYLQLMELPSGGTQTIQLETLTRNLKILAREYGVPIVVLSQLSRKVEERQDKRPMLSDLRSSGSLEQDADVVIFLYRDEYYNPSTDKSNIAEIIIAKQREGATGMVETYFNPATQCFQDLEKEF